MEPSLDEGSFRVGIGIGSRKFKKNKLRTTFDGMRWGEGFIRANEMTGPAIQDTSWQKAKEGYGSGWQEPKRTTKEERRARREERNNRNALRDLIQNRKDNLIKDPHADDDKGKLKLNREGKEGYLADQLMRGGSIFAAKGGLCLDGEENGVPATTEGETLFYSIKDGERKWRKGGGGDSGAGIKTEERSVITALRYDTKTHQLLAVFETVKVIKGGGGDSGGGDPEETVIFTATPLSAELGGS